ncbi:MAG: DUF5658 family protein [Planctomycetota bacterium]
MLDADSFSKPLLFPTLYRWYIIAATLDILCTYTILVLGGVEVNAIANRVIQSAGLPGMIAYKFIGVAFVLAVCEFVGRRKHHIGKRLAIAAIAISAFPVVVAVSQLTLVAGR